MNALCWTSTCRGGSRTAAVQTCNDIAVGRSRTVPTIVKTYQLPMCRYFSAFASAHPRASSKRSLFTIRLSKIHVIVVIRYGSQFLAGHYHIFLPAPCVGIIFSVSDLVNRAFLPSRIFLSGRSWNWIRQAVSPESMIIAVFCPQAPTASKFSSPKSQRVHPSVADAQPGLCGLLHSLPQRP